MQRGAEHGSHPCSEGADATNRRTLQRRRSRPHPSRHLNTSEGDFRSHSPRKTPSAAFRHAKSAPNRVQVGRRSPSTAFRCRYGRAVRRCGRCAVAVRRCGAPLRGCRGGGQTERRAPRAERRRPRPAAARALSGRVPVASDARADQPFTVTTVSPRVTETMSSTDATRPNWPAFVTWVAPSGDLAEVPVSVRSSVVPSEKVTRMGIPR